MATIPEPVLDVVRRRDELLSLLYWLRADRLNDAPSAGDLTAFMGATPVLEDDLRALVEAGLLEAALDGTPHYRLTAAGLAEGKRRFDEDFSALPDDGTAGNTHEVMLGVCGPNSKCVKNGSHDECAEPALVFPPVEQAQPSAGNSAGKGV